MESASFGLTEVKFSGAPEAMTFKGYGAVFGNVDSYGDVIEPGAFSDTLKAAEKSDQYPAMLLQHGGAGLTAGDMTPIGIWTALSEDRHGLVVEGKLAPTPRGQEVHALLKMTPRPAIDGLSIGYITKEYRMGRNADEPRRTLLKVDLVEVSLVTNPANGKARVSSVKADFSERQFVQLLQDAGLSLAEAKAVADCGFKGIQALRASGSAELDSLADALKRRAAALT